VKTNRDQKTNGDQKEAETHSGMDRMVTSGACMVQRWWFPVCGS